MFRYIKCFCVISSCGFYNNCFLIMYLECLSKLYWLIDLFIPNKRSVVSGHSCFSVFVSRMTNSWLSSSAGNQSCSVVNDLVFIWNTWVEGILTNTLQQWVGLSETDSQWCRLVSLNYMWSSSGVNAGTLFYLFMLHLGHIC